VRNEWHSSGSILVERNYQIEKVVV
jgi:hypothetical protein